MDSAPESYVITELGSDISTSADPKLVQGSLEGRIDSDIDKKDCGPADTKFIQVSLDDRVCTVTDKELHASADTKLLQVSLGDRISPGVNQKDDETSPVSLCITSTHTDDVLRSLFEEWKSAKEGMGLLREEVAKIRQQNTVLLTQSVEDESENLFQALDYLKRKDCLFNEKICKQSVDDLLDVLSLGTIAIQKFRKAVKQFMWHEFLGDKCLNYSVYSCLGYSVFCSIVCKITAVAPLWCVLATSGVGIGLIGYRCIRPEKPPRLDAEARKLLGIMRLLENSFNSILTLLHSVSNVKTELKS